MAQRDLHSCGVNLELGWCIALAYKLDTKFVNKVLLAYFLDSFDGKICSVRPGLIFTCETQKSIAHVQSTPLINSESLKFDNSSTQ